MYFMTNIISSFISKINVVSEMSLIDRYAGSWSDLASLPCAKHNAAKFLPVFRCLLAQNFTALSTVQKEVVWPRP